LQPLWVSGLTVVLTCPNILSTEFLCQTQKAKTTFGLMIMTYPPAPWNLYGNALQSFHLIDLESAKALVPSDLEIVSVLPGKTLGGLYLSVYEPNSTLSYHELIVVAALVRYRGTIGTWISHIYVDHPESVEGGRNIWGLPKEMADFTWSNRSAPSVQNVKVAQGNTLLCEAQYSQGGLPLSPWGKSKISSNVFGGLAQDILAFQGNFEARLRWIRCRLTIPSESPFAAIHLGHPWMTVQLRDLHLTANIPSIAGQWTSEPSRQSVSLYEI
jgi:acetoacetate decarboxylase